jgi:hypothetical protein
MLTSWGKKFKFNLVPFSAAWCKSTGLTMILAHDKCLRHTVILISFYSRAGTSTVYVQFH